MGEEADSFVVVRLSHTDEDDEAFDPLFGGARTHWPTSAWPSVVEAFQESPAEMEEAEKV